MLALVIFALLSLILSLAVDRKKTYEGCRQGLMMFLNILPTLLTMLVVVSFILYFVPTSTISALLGARSGPLGFLIAGLTGAIAMIPAFVAFPLGKILLSQQIPASTVAVFLTTLMMVGIITLPLEIKFFGLKAAVMRNFLSFLGALLIGLLIGVFI